MKDFEKFLRNSQRLEEFQTARKAKEVGEIQKFEKETERHKYQELEQILEFESAVNEWQKQKYDEPEIDEQQWEQQRVQKKYE